MVFDTVHCLFEQSGTFKKAFEELGYKAIDYDINKTENVDVQKTIESSHGFDRSVISAAFAKNFIETYIVG